MNGINITYSVVALGDYVIADVNVIGYVGTDALNWGFSECNLVNDLVAYMPANCAVIGGEGTLSGLFFYEAEEE